MTKLIENTEARNEVAAMIGKAKTAKAGRQTNGARAMVNAYNARWLAPKEEAIIIYGSSARAIFSPAGVRSETNEDRILFYGREGVLVHEEIADRADFTALLRA